VLSATETIPDKLNIVFRMGSSVFVSGDEDNPVGFDIDIVERFVAWNKSNKGPFTTYNRAFVGDMNTLLEFVQDKKCDLAVGSVTATQERDKRVDFSNPYLPVRLVLVTPKGHLQEGDYKDTLAGKSVGAITGSTSAVRVKELKEEVTGLIVKTGFLSNDDLFEALLSDPPVIDAAVTDITHYWDPNQRDKIDMVASMGSVQGLAFVLPEGSPLRERVNAFLEEFTHSPSYFTLVRRYFGDEAAKMIQSARK
jgi:ABC-type amino acid transport substrate-binding protein